MNQIKLFFSHDAASADSKDLAKKTVSDKVLENRAYEITLNHIMMDNKED